MSARATEGVESLDVSEHDTYTDEELNALTPEEVPAFLERCREVHPRHHAMIYLGLVTGLRPSSLGPCAVAVRRPTSTGSMGAFASVALTRSATRT